MNKLLKLSETHYIIVDDSEIKKGDWVTNGVEVFLRESMHEYSDEYANKYWQKITHSTEPLEDIGLNTSMGNQLGFACIQPLLLSEVKELVYGYSVDKLAEDYIERNFGKSNMGAYAKDGFIEGFKVHQGLVKDKLFPVEQMKRIYEKGYSAGRNELSSRESDKIKYDFIQSLLSKTEWEVKFDENGKLMLI